METPGAPFCTNLEVASSDFRCLNHKEKEGQGKGVPEPERTTKTRSSPNQFWIATHCFSAFETLVLTFYKVFGGFPTQGLSPPPPPPPPRLFPRREVAAAHIPGLWLAAVLAAHWDRPCDRGERCRRNGMTVENLESPDLTQIKNGWSLPKLRNGIPLF